MKASVKYIVLLPLLFLTCSFSGSGQNLLKNFLTVENGLSHNEVTSIVQDKDGFIWIGTRGGLNRYDGYGFDIFNQVPGDTNSLVNPSVESLFVDSKGNIWIGTKSGGVSRYNPVSGIFKNFAVNYKTENEILTDNRVLSLNEDDEGRIWIGTWESGVIVYDETRNTKQHFLKNQRINKIIKTTEGEMWIGTESGIYRYKSADNTFEYFAVGSCQEIIYDDKRNVLWMVQTNEAGFRMFDLRSKQNVKLKMPLSVSNLRFGNPPYESIFLDSKDRCWLGTWGTGLYTFSPEDKRFLRYLIYPENRGTINKDYDAILEIFEDRDGNIWLGTNGGGVCVLTEKLKFNQVGYHPETNKGLKNTRIMSVVDDRSGNLWLGTIGSGLIWSPDRENFYGVQYPENVEKTRFFTIKNLFEDSSGKIWAGTGARTFEIAFEGGVPKMVDAMKKYGSAGLNRQMVSFLETDDIIWMGSLQHGAYLYDKTNNYQLIKRIHQGARNSERQKSNRISYLLKDSRGRIWAGTYNGLHIYNPEDTSLVISEEFYKIEGEFTGNIITCIDEDNRGNIWIGTPNGLNKLSETGNGIFKVEIFTDENGFASNFIKGIAHDLNGNIWLSTNVGISKLETRNNYRVVNFDESDGVLGRNFTEASVFRNQKGEIFFGGSKGLTYFDPADIIEDRVLHKPIITKLTVLNKVVHPGAGDDSGQILKKSITHTQAIELSYRQNNFELEFSALDYRSMGRNLYKYKLENHDEDWHEIGTRRYVNFNNLRPGEYKLLVKNANSHNIWNEEPAELTIRIKPPLYQTWYALLFYIFIILGIVTIIRINAVKQVRLTNSLEMEKFQHEQDRKINEMKLRFFTNLSHEFRTPLTLILAPIKELLAKKDVYQLPVEVQSKIGIIQNNSLRLLKLVNQLLDFRRIESANIKLAASKTDFDDFVSEVCFPFFELAEINNIRFVLNISLQNKEIWIDRDKMEVVLNNLISNSFKHIQENGKIEVLVYEEEEEVLLSVTDNGPGIPGSEINNIFERFYRVGNSKGYGSSGIGLALAKRFVELHKGTISVVSEPNTHTEFTVSLQKGTGHLKPEEMVVLEKNEPKTDRKDLFLNHVKPKRQKSPSKTGELVLIVEDNKEISEYIESLLQPDYNVQTANDGKEGYEKTVELKPDLIISDVMMPKMDGFEFCKRIRSNETTATIPLIFLTAKSDEQFKLLGTRLGADDYISKPFDPNLLLEKVRNILSSRKKLRKQYSKSVRLEPSEVEITSSEELFIEKAISTVEQNLQNEKFSSDYLAAELNMSSSSLYRKLKNLTGSSTAEFIRSIRIKRSAQLLADPERTITEIAYEVGFNDVKHFRTVFQKQFSCSPSEYRGKLKN